MSLATYMPAAQEFASVRVAAVAVPPLTLEIFRDCLKDFKVSIHLVSVAAGDVFDQQAFDACILALGSENTTNFLAALRRSTVNRRCVVYALGSPAQVEEVSEYGVNALIESATAAQILAAVRATYLLLVHRLRRHVRIPLVTPAALEIEHRQYKGMTRDVSAGGLNISSNAEAKLGSSVRVSFTLPRGVSIGIDGIVCWKTNGALGLALFNSSRQARLQKWVEEYLSVADLAGDPLRP